ncbi:ABC transporter permease [Lysinibacillus sp. BW-2-10]|uniref:ABC transporter permease n=1 Tax=Lysinibacillus sp. BW-2-10 TaxID=2590030 RepID=UPI00117D1A35|nr:ABC transporter permease [Lysinibacillus sp. BW-2-10]TSI03382.1 ABC transporter permease [Lysinibacillus sp. BW-2-10]
MINILKTKFVLLARNPASFIIITVIICLFAYILGLGQQAKFPIAVFTDLEDQQTQFFMKELGKMPNKSFELFEEREAIEKVRNGDREVAIHLKEDGFDLVIAPDYMDAPLLQHEVSTIYSKVSQKQAIIQAYPVDKQNEISAVIDEAVANPSFHINYSNFSNDGAFIWDAKLHSLFGFTLFMVIYTVANGVNHIVMERRSHIWDRLIVSSIRKSEIYIANLVYSFILGYIQIAIVLAIFYFGLSVDFYGGFYQSLVIVIPYVLCIVALSIFIASIATTPGKFNAFIVVLAVPFAMLGGAYWPLEIVTSETILALSYISPITYGMDLLYGVTLNGSSLTDLIRPLGMLLFMTVVFMGIGINVMEKKEVR